MSEAIRSLAAPDSWRRVPGRGLCQRFELMTHRGLYMVKRAPRKGAPFVIAFEVGGDTFDRLDNAIARREELSRRGLVGPKRAAKRPLKPAEKRLLSLALSRPVTVSDAARMLNMNIEEARNGLRLLSRRRLIAVDRSGARDLRIYSAPARRAEAA